MSGFFYRNYLLAVLLIVAAFCGTDALALQLVMQDIKMDLHLSDTELGVLTGIAFALSYAVMCIPLARWADRGNRVLIIALTTAVSSVFVALSGATTSFSQLLLIRIAVGCSEAGCTPPAQSLIADYFTRPERPRAVGIYLMAGSFSMLFGFGLAGWLNELLGWRKMFVILGLPGLAAAALAWFTLREPRLERSISIADKRANRTSILSGLDLQTPYSSDSHIAPLQSLKEVIVVLWGSATLRHLVYYQLVGSFFTVAVMQWQPTFLMRSYGLKTGELGTWFIVVYGLAAMAGVYLGGFLASRYAGNNERLQLRAATVAYSSAAVLAPFVYLVPKYHFAVALIGLTMLVSNLVSGPAGATILSLIRTDTRASATAIIAVLTMSASALGSLATGILSDAFQGHYGHEALRYALVAVTPGYLWAALHLWRAGTSVARELSIVQETSQGIQVGEITVGASKRDIGAL